MQNNMITIATLALLISTYSTANEFRGSTTIQASNITIPVRCLTSTPQIWARSKDAKITIRVFPSGEYSGIIKDITNNQLTATFGIENIQDIVSVDIDGTKSDTTEFLLRNDSLIKIPRHIILRTPTNKLANDKDNCNTTNKNNHRARAECLEKSLASNSERSESIIQQIIEQKKNCQFNLVSHKSTDFIQRIFSIQKEIADAYDLNGDDEKCMSAYMKAQKIAEKNSKQIPDYNLMAENQCNLRSTDEKRSGYSKLLKDSIKKLEHMSKTCSGPRTQEKKNCFRAQVVNSAIRSFYGKYETKDRLLLAKKIYASNQAEWEDFFFAYTEKTYKGTSLRALFCSIEAVEFDIYPENVILECEQNIKRKSKRSI